MTLRIKIEVPADGGPYEAKITESNGSPARILVPGESVELYVHSGNSIQVTELPAGTKAAAAPAATASTHGLVSGDDFPLGKACDLSGEGTCDACQ